MRDTLPLFRCLVEPHGDKYRAASEDFPKVYGYGESPEAARNSLRRMILEVWFSFRSR